MSSLGVAEGPAQWVGECGGPAPMTPCLFPPENGNRYEGNWQRGVKNGSGRFFHLDHGQLFEGFWVGDVAKCGTMIDFGRDEAPQPTQFPIPEVGSSPQDPGTTPNLQTGNSSPPPATPNLSQPSQETDKVLFSVRASSGRLAVPPTKQAVSQRLTAWVSSFPPGQNSRSRRCVGGSLGYVQEDRRRRRLMPGERQSCQPPSDVVWAAPGLSSGQERSGAGPHRTLPQVLLVVFAFSPWNLSFPWDLYGGSVHK